MSTLHAERPRRSERKARGSGHLRRAELLTAAQRIFTEAGYEGATIRRIAEEVGVSSTALYMYFQDKSQIMLEICVQSLEEIIRELKALAERDMDPQDRLRAMLEIMLGFGFAQPTAYQLLYCVAPKEVSERRHRVIAPLSRTCFETVQAAVESAMAAGRLRGDMPARDVTEALIAACHGVLSMRIANPNAPWREPEVVSRALLAGLFEGFGAR